MAEENFVSIEKLTKVFIAGAPPALDAISVTIPKGQMVGLAGPDGAGKTTLIRLMAGLLKPTSGKATVAGFDTIVDAAQIHQRIGYMPQKFGLYEDLTVIQNLNLYADLRGLPADSRHDTFEKLFSFTNLAPFKKRLAGDLSGGMKQKLGLACALIVKPELLLLDEPSVGVDPISRRELWKMVKELLEEGISVLWSTAYLDEAERCDRVLLLNEGKLLYQGSPSELTKRVKGRTFKIPTIQANRRQLLSQVLEEKSVIDGVIQGSDLRIVLRADSPPPADIADRLVSSPPRFEDAFIDILGGGPGGISLLAEKAPQMPKEKHSVVEAKHLVKKFGSFVAVDDITFSVPQGEIFGFLGPNGAGKSTTFKMMCGLLKPTSGESYVGGYNLQTAPAKGRAQIGYMAQKFSLYGTISVLQNLEFFSGIYNLTGKHQREMIEEMIEVFNLKNYLNVTAETLPLGFKQRLALACAVMHRPSVLFLDEPTSGVDPITRREFWTHINGLVEKGVTVVVTTHFMDEAEYCDRIGLIYNSRMITIGTPDQLKASARTDQNQDPSLEDAFIQLIDKYREEIHAE